MKEYTVAMLSPKVETPSSTDKITSHVTEHYEYYKVAGNTEQELRRQMSRNGTKWNDGKTYDALTTWDITWDYTYNTTEEGCSVASFTTDVDIIFRLPKFESAGAPPALSSKWDNYMTNLVIHENGHRDLALEAAAELNRAVAELGPTSNPSELDRKIRALGKEKMAAMKNIQVDYDHSTGHGKTQGAVFP